MIPVALMIFAGVLVVTLLVLWLARSASLDYAEDWRRLHEPGAATLAYRVPDGQDAADVVIALDRAGYTCVEDTGHGVRQVLVSCPGGADTARSQVRAVIEAAGVPSGRTVRFADEPKEGV